MKTLTFTTAALSVVATLVTASADPAKRTKVETKPAPMMHVVKTLKGVEPCDPGWVRRPLELNAILGDCVPGSFTTVQPFDN